VALVSDLETPEPTRPARCPWCSSELPEGDVPTCPTCGAQLVGDETSQVPGVTAIDAEAILRARSAAGGSRGRNPLTAWLSGESDVPPPGIASEGALQPPSLDVRREILRLELAAAEAELRAEAEAIRLERGELGDLDAAPTDDAAQTPATSDAVGDAAAPTEPDDRPNPAS
jgi:hypothetical protein